MIVPVLKQLLGKNPNLELLIVGILELPVELKLFASQIQMEGFVELPKTAGADCVGGYQLGSALPIRFLTVRNRKINGWKRLWCRP